MPSMEFIDNFYNVPPDVPMPGMKYFHWSDWLVFGLFLGISILVGLYQSFMARKNQATSKDYHTGGGNMSIFPVALSLLTSFLSAILILGTPAEMYTAGTEYWMSVWGQMLAVLGAAVLFVPLMYPLKLVSSYEYLELRFKSKTAKLTGTLILLMKELLYMGVVLYSPATALEAVTGFPEWASIVLGGLIAIIYVAMGGMKASVWTSAFQAFVMAAGVSAVIIKGCYDLGGIENVWNLNWETGRIVFFDFDPNPLERHTFWTLVVGSFVSWLSTYGANQAAVQRYCSVKDQKSAVITVLLNMPGLFIMITLCALSGMTIFAWYYYVGCDILRAGYVSNSNQVIAYYVLDRLYYPTVPGLFMACLFAGALSTMSSSCGACAAVFWEDVLKWKLGHIKDSYITLINKLLVVIFGAAGIGMAFMSSNLGGTVLQASLSFTGAAGGPMLGLFLLGGFFPCANWIGAVIGGLVGLGFPLWISFGQYGMNMYIPYLNSSTESCYNFTDEFPPPTTGSPPLYPDDVTGLERLYLVSYMWFSAIGAGTTVVLGLTISMLTGFDDPENSDPRFHLPLFDWMFCCLPNKSLSVLRCHIDKSKIKNEDEEDLSISEVKVVPDGDEKINYGYKTEQDGLTNAAVISGGVYYQNPNGTLYPDILELTKF